MVTGVPEGLRNRFFAGTGFREEIPHWSFGTSSGKQKKARSTRQPHIRSENVPATIEADQILLPLQQLATKSNSTNSYKKIEKDSKLAKSFTTTMPTFDGQSEKFKLFEDVFQTSLKIHNQRTEKVKINYFHSLMRGDALQTFKNITRPIREKLGEILTVFRGKKRETPVNGYKETQLSTTGLQSGKPEVNWFSRRSPGTDERHIRSCRSRYHRTIRKLQNASPPVEINQLGAFGK